MIAATMQISAVGRFSMTSTMQVKEQFNQRALLSIFGAMSKHLKSFCKFGMSRCKGSVHNKSIPA